MKYIYSFGSGRAEGSAKMRSLLGGKGANLAEMTHLGIPVPPGFTLSTKACLMYYESNKKFPPGLNEQIAGNLKKLESAMGKKFGSSTDPLLVSVRSGAAISMPGMMDTILNLGLNEKTVLGLANRSGNPRFAFDAYRRFIQMFGNVVLNIDHAEFERLLVEKKRKTHAATDADLTQKGLQELVVEYKDLVRYQTGKAFPEDPRDQLKQAIEAVFASWNNDRAITYRNLNEIPHSLGTGVNVQSMVFGNLGNDSGTGVVFTRDPRSGARKLYGEFLLNAQGEDVVAGIRTPQPIDQLKKEMPKAYAQLVQLCNKLEKHYREMQDIEFTIEARRLFLLQTRTGTRTAEAAVRIAVEMVQEKRISKTEALLRVKPNQLDQLLHPTIDPKEKLSVIAKGLPASPGAAVGVAVFDSHRAIQVSGEGKPVVLVRAETSPNDVGGMAASEGILTARGGMTSHAAVVGRGMGKPCVVGCSQITVNEGAKVFSVNGHTIKEGDPITLDGSLGTVMPGKAKLVKPSLKGQFRTLMGWADAVRKLKVRTNADTPHDAQVAIEFGAEGIGLCRTEHMFFGKERLPHVQAMIMAKNTAEREKALAKLLPMQKKDFRGIFKAMKTRPVTIRLLDPPLHEFVPHTQEDMAELAEQLKIPVKQIRTTSESLREFNPMLGHRGCRLGLVYPEINVMQARAIFEAVCELRKEGVKVNPEIMVPLVGHVNELQKTREVIVRVAEEVMQELKVRVPYLIGTMIEVPRAALTSDQIAVQADFFSFGTNDLTQMTFGFSRDDIGKFLPDYIEQGILERDPFVSLDASGVGQLVTLSVQRGRQIKPALKMGICGEHGGDPSSVEFCHQAGLDYVSCSPYRVPIARLAAAQAAVKGGGKRGIQGSRGKRGIQGNRGKRGIQGNRGKRGIQGSREKRRKSRKR
jgi:pyruvate, orthophosphate dikinase